MKYGLIAMFSSLYNRETLNEKSVNIQNDLFDFSEQTPPSAHLYDQADIDLLCGYFVHSADICVSDKNARDFYELDAGAFYTFIHAWMSELPIEKEMLAFGRKIIAETEKYSTPDDKRRAAQRAASDRSDENILTVLNTAAKVQYEIHRMMGLLRFSPDKTGMYTAVFTPDYFILAALKQYFTDRFGDTAWAVIDKKRALRLYRLPGECAKLVKQDEINFGNTAEGGGWEDLWRHYHKTINNESRKNLSLQRQFMPVRYWKYLPEMQENTGKTDENKEEKHHEQ